MQSQRAIMNVHLLFWALENLPRITIFFATLFIFIYLILKKLTLNFPQFNVTKLLQLQFRLEYRLQRRVASPEVARYGSDLLSQKRLFTLRHPVGVAVGPHQNSPQIAPPMLSSAIYWATEFDQVSYQNYLFGANWLVFTTIIADKHLLWYSSQCTGWNMGIQGEFFSNNK